MEPIHLDKVKSCLDELNEKFPRFGIPHLALGEFCDIKNAALAWPNAGNAGVYLMFNENRELLYIGKASCSTTMGYRLGAHFNKLGVPKSSKYEKVRFVCTIPVPKDREFEAPAIEEFLISRLNPSLCSIGRTEPVPVQEEAGLKNST